MAGMSYKKSLCSLSLGALILLSGCAGMSKGKTYAPQEKFASGETFSRLFDAAPVNVCKSARLALLSQGYLVTSSDPNLIEGKKQFLPEAGSHIEMSIRVVCVPDAPNGSISLAFATAVQDTYTLRQVSNSASVGVGAIGSVSVPFGETNEGLTKVGSQTISTADFYDRFFALIKQYLNSDVNTDG
jgi:hypothetical protein